jgi:hypothetical protein
MEGYRWYGLEDIGRIGGKRGERVDTTSGEASSIAVRSAQ